MSRLTSPYRSATAHPACLALGCLGFAAAPALAQDSAAAPTKSTELGSVTVTDTAIEDGYKVETLQSPKYTAPLADTPQTIQVINRQVMQDQAATTLSEAMRNIAGVGTFNAGEGNGGPLTGDALYMRGFDMSNSIYVDGIRDLGAVSRDVFNTEQIEVTKGAAGTDYGRSSPGGSINMASKQANLRNSMDASLGGGMGDYLRGTLDVNHVLGKTTALRVNLMGQNAGVAGRDQVKNDRWGVAGALATGLGTATRVTLDVLHVEQRNRPDSGLPTIGWGGFSDATMNAAAKVNGSNYYGSTDSHDNSNATMVTARIEHDLAPDITLRNTARWGRLTQNYLAITAGVPTVTAADTADWTTTRLGAAKDLANSILTDQAGVSAKFATGAIRHSVSAGVELSREKQTNYGLTASGTIASLNLYDPAYTDSGRTITRSGSNAYWQTDTVGIYAFDTVALTRRVQLDLGLRYDHYDTTYLASGTNLEAKGDLWTYKVGGLYKLTGNGNVYVNYAVAQQPPGATSSFGAYSLSSSASSATNPDMKPQKSRSIEGGTKWEFFGKRLLVTGAVFRSWIENEVYANDDGTYSQIGEKRVTGVELSATGQITPDWNVITSYTHQNTQITTGAATAQDGSSSLPYAPDNAFSLWSTYRLPHGLTLGGGARYTGQVKRQSKLATTPDHIPDYWVFDGVATYRFSRVADLQLNIFNIFNKKYMTSLNYLGYRYQPGLARSVRATLGVHF
jgi:catecholate siderophore receptor